MSRRAGMTLIEMLVALVVFSLVLGGALQALSAQRHGFERASDEVLTLQNLRLPADLLERELRTAGANVPDAQPALVYAGPDAVAFNADFASNIAGDPFAVYVDPDAPAGQVSALPRARQIAIPGSAPAFTYPAMDYEEAGTPSAAETIVFFFTADLETPRTDDYVLRRQVNDQPAEVVARGLLRAPSKPFFRYHALRTPATGAADLSLIDDAALPIRHDAAEHLSAADVGAAARIDSVRAVEMNVRATNGRTGARERIRDLSVIVPLPNVGLRKLQTCGDGPMFGQPVIATPVAGSGIEIQWPAAVDESGGERDVVRYVLWRRAAGSADWGDPYVSIPAGGAPYLYADVGVASGTAYEYAVAAQDCTPTMSDQSLSGATVAP